MKDKVLKAYGAFANQDWVPELISFEAGFEAGVAASSLEAKSPREVENVFSFERYYDLGVFGEQNLHIKGRIGKDVSGDSCLIHLCHIDSIEIDGRMGSIDLTNLAGHLKDSSNLKEDFVQAYLDELERKNAL